MEGGRTRKAEYPAHFWYVGEVPWILYSTNRNSASGKTRTIEMDNKWSTTIIRELMEAAGGDPWREYKKLRTAGGLPLLPGEEDEHKHRRAVTLKQSDKVTKVTRQPKPIDL